jgi:MscS family membrane protein
MVSRRLWENVGIRYQDAHAVEAITRDIRNFFQQHEEIDQDELITINFTTYGDYSLNIMLYAFTRVTDWQRFQEIKQEILLKVRDIIDGHGAELAIPASRIYLPEGVEREGARRDDTQRDEAQRDEAQRNDADTEHERSRRSASETTSSRRSREGSRQNTVGPSDTESGGEGEGEA